MQNKTALWIFTVLLALACVRELSFTWVTNSVEKDAAEVAMSKLDSALAETPDMPSADSVMLLNKFESDYLFSKNNEEVYPLLGYTYSQCKQRELNKGLDLQGGMNVTLEVSVVELIEELADKSNDPTFRQAINNAKEAQKSGSDNFVSLFGQEINKIDPSFQLTSIFSTRQNKEMFPSTATNEEVLQIIREQSEAAVKNTEEVLRKRIDNLGVVQPKIQRLSATDRIVVELPGVKDPARVRKILQGTAKLEFWETYDVGEVLGSFDQANTYLKGLIELEGAPEETAEAGLGLDSNSVDTNQVVEADLNEELATADADSSEEDNLLDALASDSDTASEGLDAQLTDAEFARKNPLISKVRFNYYQDAQGNPVAEGPVVGYVLERNMKDLKQLLRDEKVLRFFPKNIRFYYAAKPALNRDNQPLFEDGDSYALYAIRVLKRDGTARLEGDAVTNAKVTSDQMGNPEVNLVMNPSGAKMWRTMTREAAEEKKSIAVVLDSLVYSAPSVNEEIKGGSSSISGRFTQQEAADLASVLKAGKLPVSAQIIEEAVVGPSLGEEAISDGIMSFLIAFALILVYMVFYYARAGVVADIALIANIFFVFGVLTGLGATLTLPGIAGIVLTIGMSVDANVLIYERIREELAAGKGIKLAIADGYNSAYSSIIDANVTTLLTGIVLAVFGTGPIQGFATTLIIGICTSLFSAIFITRLIFEWQMKSKDNFSFATSITDGAFKNINWQIVAKRKTYYIISGLIIVAGVVSMATKGFDLGVDFSGGRTYIVRFENPADVSEVSKALSAVFVDENGVADVPEVKTFGESNQVKITTNFMIDSDSKDADDQVEKIMFQGLNAMGDKFEKMSSQKVGPTIADDIKQSAFWAVLVSLIAIFAYIVARFRKLQFGVGALVAMAHDVLVVLGIFSIFYGIAPWSMEIDQAFIAAILTVVGYSINDTVVVFDRIREYVGLHKNRPYKQVVNEALNSTLSRTINTSLSTFLVLLMIFAFGGEVIRGFVFALMVGVVVGTYSSLCVATPAVIDLTKDEDEKKDA
ncbi:protein translocase subunit SecDF [bacterium SCSIO 12741]|nr:protein translocase subunit SecDF [bacterium SCSIO 12741]